MDLMIPNYLIEDGFFPVYFPKSESPERTYSLELPREVRNYRGVSFNVSRLGKGTHHWDFWMKTGKYKHECPQKITLRGRT